MHSFSRAKFLTLALGGLVGTLSTALISCGNGSQTVGGAAEESFVAITQIVEHPALNAVRDGVKDELAEAGYTEGETLRWEWQSAQGSPVAATQIASKYAGAQPDVIVAIATPSAQFVTAATSDTPVIFSAVTDPVGAELVEDAEKPGGNISGVSDLSPIKQQLELIQEIMPEVKTLGVIYSASKDNSVSLVALINENAPDLGIEIEAVTVSTSGEVADVARSLVDTVDAIYVPTDNTVVSALESVIQVGQEAQVPVFAEDTDSVERGAIAAISFDYYDVGRQTGAMVTKVLKGSKPGDLAVEFVQDLKLSINPAAAEAMGVELPESVTSRADLSL